ncbi:MAG: succinylglutamate desuccinylase [Clostridia bacterium]|nr:succinylglutamate desuccinylase [Clostridia bacterium]NCC43442.1 succinylglutamate desuccinylase [Clostridia bacterium]
MKKITILSMKALYRDDFKIEGYVFGSGHKSACIVGNLRGNEVQQLYACSQMIAELKKMEAEGRIEEGKEILVIPSMNPGSMNVKRRFWPTDNTDINRMFPGYDKGETTQRIAAAIFDYIKDYDYGIQYTSFYMPGTFMPHVRMMRTGFEDIEDAKDFGLPYVVVRNTRPYDTTTLNYNWQIWETNAYSIYTTTTDTIDGESVQQSIRAVSNFLNKRGIINGKTYPGYQSEVIEDTEFVSVRANHSGFLNVSAHVWQEVKKGDLLAVITDPMDGEVKERIEAPCDGIIFFIENEPIIYSHTSIIKIVEK